MLIGDCTHLLHKTHPASEPFDIPVFNPVPINGNRASCWIVPSFKKADYRAFSRSACTYQGSHIVCRDIKIDALQDRNVRPGRVGDF